MAGLQFGWSDLLAVGPMLGTRIEELNRIVKEEGRCCTPGPAGLWVWPCFRSAGQPVLRKEALEAGFAPSPCPAQCDAGLETRSVRSGVANGLQPS